MNSMTANSHNMKLLFYELLFLIIFLEEIR